MNRDRERCKLRNREIICKKKKSLPICYWGNLPFGFKSNSGKRTNGCRPGPGQWAESSAGSTRGVSHGIIGIGVFLESEPSKKSIPRLVNLRKQTMIKYRYCKALSCQREIYSMWKPGANPGKCTYESKRKVPTSRPRPPSIPSSACLSALLCLLTPTCHCLLFPNSPYTKSHRQHRYLVNNRLVLSKIYLFKNGKFFQMKTEKPIYCGRWGTN